MSNHPASKPDDSPAVVQLEWNCYNKSVAIQISHDASGASIP